MSLTGSQKLLAGACVVLIIAAGWFVPFATQSFGPGWGYLAIFLFYWFGFCLPVGLAFQGVSGARENLRLTFGKLGKWRFLMIAQIVLTLAAWPILAGPQASLAVVPIALAAGLVNGFSEEFFWRGAFLSQGRGNWRFQALGVVLFTLWHMPLTLAHGIHYADGPIMLVGGAFALGAFYAFIANRANAIGWTSIGHILINWVILVPFVADNFA